VTKPCRRMIYHFSLPFDFAIVQVQGPPVAGETIAGSRAPLHRASLKRWVGRTRSARLSWDGLFRRSD
jgi:hypothetical protein